MNDMRHSKLKFESIVGFPTQPVTTNMIVYRALNISRNNFQSKIDDFTNFQSIIENFSKKEAISEYHIVELNAKATYMRDKGSE